MRMSSWDGSSLIVHHENVIMGWFFIGSSSWDVIIGWFFIGSSSWDVIIAWFFIVGSRGSSLLAQRWIFIAGSSLVIFSWFIISCIVPFMVHQHNGYQRWLLHVDQLYLWSTHFMLPMFSCNYFHHNIQYLSPRYSVATPFTSPSYEVIIDRVL